MFYGTVKIYNEDKGFGFISNGTRNDYFFHIQGWMHETLPRAGDYVSFDIELDERSGRNRAVRVQLAN